MKTKTILFNLSFFLLVLASCKKDSEPLIEIINGSGQYEYTTNVQKPITGPLTSDRLFFVDTEIEDLKNKIKSEISSVEEVTIENVSLTKLNLKSVSIFPEINSNENPAYLALEESQFRVKIFDTNLGSEYVELGLFKFEDSSDSVLTYEIIDEDLLLINHFGFAPFDFEFKWNELLETYEILSDIEIIFDYEYEVQK